MVLCRDYQFSTRRACGLIGFSRSSNEYRGRPDRHARIRERLVTLSGKHRRYGYRMLHAKLGQEGFKVNVKVVERLYREERLTLRRRNRKKIPKGVREGAWCPIAANQRWSLDFTMDALANGRKFRTVNLKDDCTRECPAIDVALSIPGSRVVEMLERVARERGYPDVLTVDNGPELRGRALDGWADDHGVQLYFIDPGGADPERLHRKFQRPVSRRMPELELVHLAGRGRKDHRGLADRLQSKPAPLFAELSNPGRICRKQAFP